MTRYTYDRTGSILSVDYAGEQTEENAYNEIGLLTTVTTAEGVTEYQYDDASRLLSVTQPNGDTVSYTYDGHGNRLSMTYPDGKTVTYAYDEMDRLVSVTGVDDITTTYEYDALGRRTKTTGSKETTEYTYDEVGDLVAQTTTGAYDLALEYTYDLSGRMTGESRTENGTTLDSSFAYDPLGQLTGFTRSDGITEGYTYDDAGNMLTKTQSGVKTEYTYNAANQLTQSVTGGNTTAYTYDANGNLTAKQTATGTTRYTYNALNLLQSYTGEDGYTETYTYNANRLLSSVTTPESTTNLTWDILYGDGVVISETTGKNTTNYTYGLERISALTGSTRTEYIYDVRGSVAAEVSYNNAWYTFGGTLAWKNVTSKSYTAFGEQIGEKTSGFGYNGEYYNAVTGQIYLRARFYEPEMNRFSQKDILRGDAADPVSLNRYAYVQNDPVNFIDPSGMSVRSFLAKSRAAVTSAVNHFKANPAKATVRALRTVSNAIKHPVSTVKKAVKTARRAITELIRPDPKPKIAKTAVPPTNPPTKDEGSSIGDGTELKRRGSATQQGSNNAKNPLSAGGSGNSAKIVSLSRTLPSVRPKVGPQTTCTPSSFKPSIEQFRDYLIEARGGENNNGTFTIGANISAGFGAGVGLNVGLGIDNNGNVGIIASYAVGAAMPSASVVGYISSSNASSLDALGGESMVYGVSGGEIAVGGIEVATFSDIGENGENKVAVSGTAQAGLGVGIPVEIHGEYSNSGVISVNLYDALISICDFLLR